MRLVLDTCVLVPTVMRGMLLAFAKAGAFDPIWSDKIVGEWQHTAAKRGPMDVIATDAALTFMRADFPTGERKVPEITTQYWLPDPADVHVLAVAVASSADGIITSNAKDFPRNVLGEEGLLRWDPDQFCMAAWEKMAPAARDAILMRCTEFEADLKTPRRSIMKKARLPRLGKLLEAL